MAAVIIATIAVSAIPVAVAYRIAKGDVKSIETTLHQKAGKATFKVDFGKPAIDLLGDSNSFGVKITCEGGPCPPEKVADYLSTILTGEFQSPEHPHAIAKVTVKQYLVENSHANGKTKAPLEFKDETTTYTINVTNDQITAKRPVIYCSGTTVNTGTPLLNTWFTSPTPIGSGISTTISWTAIYSVSLSQVVLKEGKTVKTSITQRASLGQQVNFTFINGVPSNTPPTSISDTSIIQVYLVPGFDYEGWAVGFGIADQTGKDNPVMVVQADAGTYYNFTPHPSYQVGLASEDNTNKLVDESELTDCVQIQFTGRSTTVDIEHKVNGNWVTTYPSSLASSFDKGNLIKPRVALQLVKRTVTSTTTVEEYA